MPSLAADTPDRVTDSHREASPPRSSPHEADTVAEQLEGTRITRKGDPHSQFPPHPSYMVVEERQCASRSTSTPTKYALQSLQMHQRRVGCSLRGTHCKGNLVSSRSKLHINYLELRQSFGPKRVLRPLVEQFCCHRYSQHHGGCLY